MSEERMEKVASNVQLTYVKQANGRLVAKWDKQWVLIDSVRFAQRIEPGTSYEVDVFQVEMKNRRILTSKPTRETIQALADGTAWTGPVKINVCFRPKSSYEGVYTVETLTGKLVLPDVNVRVWVNGFFDYLSQDEERVLNAYPIEEPATKRYDPKNPNEPFTYKSHPDGRPFKLVELMRQDRADEPRQGEVTFNRTNRGSGLVGRHPAFGQRPVLAAWGNTYLVNQPMKVKFFDKGAVVVAKPMSSIEELKAMAVCPENVVETPPPPKRSETKPATANQEKRPPRSTQKEKAGEEKACVEGDGTLAGSLAKLMKNM